MDPNNAWAQVILGWAYEQKSMIKEAIVEFQNALNHWKDGSLPLGALGHAYGIAGKKKEAQEILEKLLEKSKQIYVPAYDIAAVYVGLGEKDQVFEWLSKAFEERSGFLIYIKCDRRFDGLRSDPRYEVLLKRIGLPLGTIKS
jgi:tetratricopeptide (TPR) repeat protein